MVSTIQRMPECPEICRTTSVTSPPEEHGGDGVDEDQQSKQGEDLGRALAQQWRQP
jgi:hypothetical protein